MAINPKQILDTAVGLGQSAVRRLRGDNSGQSGAPSTVGAARPGQAGGPKSATAKPAKRRSTAAAARRGATGSGKGVRAKTAPKAKRPATPSAAVETGKAKPAADKTSTPRKRATGRRTTASEAAATSGKEVADAASGKEE
jgi:hypothetical protein